MNCTACGADLGEVEVGDHVECGECVYEYDFVESDRDDHPGRLVVDHSALPDDDGPAIDGIESVEDGIVTYTREDGRRVKDDIEDFPGALPDGITGDSE